MDHLLQLIELISIFTRKRKCLGGPVFTAANSSVKSATSLNSFEIFLELYDLFPVAVNEAGIVNMFLFEILQQGIAVAGSAFV